MNAQEIEYENALTESIHATAGDPLAFVMLAFPWGKGELAGKSPEAWQKKLLTDIRDGLKTVDEVIRIARRSGHGIGKSALVSWLILWSVATMVDTRGIVTANTDTQLRTKTWAELGKWYFLCIVKHWFTFTATSIYSADSEHEKTWRIDAIPWSENNTEAFAGMHNQGKRIVIIFDEASTIAAKIWEVTKGALTDMGTEIIWCVFGNPTINTGSFHDCFGKDRHRWNTESIDSRSVSFTNKNEIQEWIDDHGEDSDLVRVRVRGIEPRQAVGQFISSEYIDAARGRYLKPEQYSFAAKIITLDPSWTGNDEWVIAMRQGLMFKIMETGLKNDNDMVMAEKLAFHEDSEKADAVFIDVGYGTGVYSAGKTMNRNWMLVEFGGESSDVGYLNKRAEMYKLTRDWLRDGGAIENDEILCSDLAGPWGLVMASGPNTGKIYLESKKDMKKRGLASPNRGDALVMTFAFPVKRKDGWEQKFKNNLSAGNKKSYDPFMEFNDTKEAYDPFRMLT